MSGDPGRSQLLPETEYLLERDRAAYGTALTAYNGGDPLTDPPAFGYPNNMQVEIERRLVLEADRTKKMNDVFSSPESGWGTVQKFMDGVFDQYKTQNQAQLIKVPKNEQEALAQMQQLQPVRVDPNEVANIRQLVVSKLIPALKAVDPRFDFWTDPRTSNYAQWLNREAGVGTAGFMSSGEQPVELGAVGRTAVAAWQGIEGMASIPINLTHGLWDIGRRSIQAMGGPDIGSSYPTNFIERDGETVDNGGKVPSLMDGIGMAWDYALGNNIQAGAAEAGRAQEWEQANRAGFGGLVTSVSRMGGELIGMQVPFGLAGQVGKMLGPLSVKGLQALGALRLAKPLTQSTDRALKIISAMNKGVGTAAGWAAYEAVNRGRVEGYGASYLHGLVMSPVLMALGTLGKKTEWFARHRAQMPAVASRAISGALEGAGFGGVETIMPDVLPSSWGFIKDPNETTWERFARNMLAFTLVKVGTGRSFEAPPEVAAYNRGVARAQFAEEVAGGRVSPETLASAPIKDEAKLRRLGELSQRAKTGDQEALAEQRRLEAELDAEEFGKGPAANEEAQVDELLARVRGDEPPEGQKPKIAPWDEELIDQRGRTRRDATKSDFMAMKIGLDQYGKQRREEMQAAGLERQLGKWHAVEIGSLEIDVRNGRIHPEDVPLALDALKSARQHLEEAEAMAQAEIEIYGSGKKPLPGAAEELAKKFPNWADVLGPMGRKVKAEDRQLWAIDRRTEIRRQLKRIDDISSNLRKPEGPRQVPGREPRPMRPVEDKPAPSKQMAQEGGREGIEPERYQDEGPLAERRAQEAAERRVRQSVDPLEDPRFRELPEALQKEIREAPDAQARKEIFAKHAGERRSGEERRVPRETPTEVETRQGDMRTAEGSRAGPQSFQQPPTRNIEPTPGVEEVPARDIFAAYEGRPARGGIRIPLTGRRVGGDPGDPVKVSHRGGKISGRGVEGLYRIFENVFRTREGRDIVVGAHEWSHAMHRHMTSQRGGRDFVQAARNQIGEILRGPDGPAIHWEMREMLKDYPGSARLPLATRWMETWAEWHARNLLGEVGLDRAHPAISRYMRTWLAHPNQARLRDQYQRIQDLIARYNAQGSEARLGQSIVSGAAPKTDVQRAQKPGPIRRFFTQLNKALFDDMAELKLSQDKWLQAVGKRPEDVSILDDPARLFDTLRMTADKVVDHFVNRGVRLPNGNFVPGLRSVMDAVRGRELDFQKFVVAIRSLDLYRAGKEVQLPIQDYTVSVNRILARNPDFNERLQDLKRWTDALIDWVAGAGSISAEDAQKIKEKYVVYVPFFRAIEGPAAHGQGRGVAEGGSGIGHIKGSTYEILDPFVKLQQVARSMVAKAHQNQVMEALYKMASSQEAGPLATVVKRTTVPTDHALSRIIEAMEQQITLPPDLVGPAGEFYEALRQADALNPQTITTFMQKVIPTGERSVIAFTPRLTEENIERLGRLGASARQLREENHKLQWLEVDPKVYEALMGIDKMPQLPASLQPVMNWLQAPRDVVRFFATGISPGFVAANLIRDALSAPLFDRNGDFRPFGGFVSLIRGAIEYHRELPRQFLSAIGRGDLRGLFNIIGGGGRVGELRELYEELGVKSSSFWTEGRQRSLIGEQMTLWQRAKAMADTVQNWFSHPENYIRMDRFRDAYQSAIRAGRSEQEAQMEALETGREATVNFARAGIWSRALNQLIPYFNAGVQGQRKLFGQLIAGGADTKGDANKARIQRGAILNGIANITVPATLLWLLAKDEDWYQDLPDWRKIGYFNMKIGDEIISVPKPFEAGVLFGGLPQIMLDHLFGSNPASTTAALKSLIGPYLDAGMWIPAFAKPLIEVAMNKNTFTGRELTPEWISRANPPQEQATFYTTEAAKIMSRAIGGKLTPIEIEQLMGGYTAGAATTAMRALDEITGLKDHPGIQTNPLLRFTKQQPHGQSSFVDRLYQMGTRLEQNEDSLTHHEQSLKRRVDNAKKKISDLRKQYRAGSITQQQAERRSYEIARPIVEDK